MQQGRVQESSRRITVRIGIWDGATEHERHIARAAPVGLAEERGEPTVGSASRQGNQHAGWSAGVMARCCAKRRPAKWLEAPSGEPCTRAGQAGPPVSAQLTLARSRNFPMYGVIAVAYSVEM